MFTHSCVSQCSDNKRLQETNILTASNISWTIEPVSILHNNLIWKANKLLFCLCNELPKLMNPQILWKGQIFREILSIKVVDHCWLAFYHGIRSLIMYEERKFNNSDSKVAFIPLSWIWWTNMTKISQLVQLTSHCQNVNFALTRVLYLFRQVCYLSVIRVYFLWWRCWCNA